MDNYQGWVLKLMMRLGLEEVEIEIDWDAKIKLSSNGHLLPTVIRFCFRLSLLWFPSYIYYHMYFPLHGNITIYFSFQLKWNIFYFRSLGSISQSHPLFFSETKRKQREGEISVVWVGYSKKKIIGLPTGRCLTIVWVASTSSTKHV